MAAQAPVQSGARDMRTDELPCHGQQVIQRQQQGTPQVNHHCFLRWREHGLQVVGSVRAVGKDVALLPLVDRLLSDTKALGQDAGWFIAGCDLGTHGGRSCAVLSTWLYSLGGLQGLYQLLQNSSGHEEWIALKFYAIVRDATVRALNTTS